MHKLSSVQDGAPKKKKKNSFPRNQQKFLDKKAIKKDKKNTNGLCKATLTTLICKILIGFLLNRFVEQYFIFDSTC